MKYFFIIVFFSLITAYPQGIDSLSHINREQKTVTDTIKNVSADTVSIPDSIKTSIAGNDTLRNLAHQKVKADTLKPIYSEPLFLNGDFISHNTLIKYYDYRYTADFLRSFPFAFIKDQGFIGQPNEVYLYGIGSGGISYFQDGILYNNRFENSLDLHAIQSEFVDSVEMIPSPRGFLYGPLNNPVSVNFITKDFLFLQDSVQTGRALKPYTKIKYLQGPNGETMFDGLFNSIIYKKLKVLFDLNSKKSDSTFTNSSYSLWQLRLRLKYYISNLFNIEGGYDFNLSETGLNGGVNVDSILKTTTNISSVLYDQYFAPVYYPDRTLKNKIHLFNLKLLSRPAENAPGEFNLYYKFDLEEIMGGYYGFSQDKNKTYGVLLRQRYNYSFLNFELNANYESSKIQYLNYERTQIVNRNENNFSASSIVSTNLIDSSFTPSVFYKFTRDSFNNNSLNGIGFDLTYKFKRFFNLYAGYSIFKNDFNQSKNVTDGEIGVNLHYPDLFSPENDQPSVELNFKFFNRNNFYIMKYADYFTTDGEYILNGSLSGIGIDFNWLFWKVLFESSAYFNFPQTKDPFGTANFVNPGIPKQKFNAGIYYKDILFKENLNLKTGFIFFYTGKQESTINNTISASVSPSLTVNFTLIGEIQKVAIVYFSWENLFNNQYYIVPYYPMPTRGIRFGLSWELLN
jgi:TonB-dependent Receptor Plug Domain